MTQRPVHLSSHAPAIATDVDVRTFVYNETCYGGGLQKECGCDVRCVGEEEAEEEAENKEKEDEEDEEDEDNDDDDDDEKREKEERRRW